MRSILRLKDNRIMTFSRMEMMGIINVTPDSFYADSRTMSGSAEEDGSHAKAVQNALSLAQRHILEGARMIDIGGESTRPGSSPVSQEEEIARICPVIRQLRKAHPEVIISADTYRAGTAAAAIEAGADMINDISGLTFEPELADVVAREGAAIVLMHTGGRPKDMQQDPHYDNVVEEVYAFLDRQIEFALSRGIGRDQIMIDMGIGFGKTREHNLALLRNIGTFDDLGCPHLLAVSRKSFIGSTLGREEAKERLSGTLAVTAFAAERGVAAARVHDVKENLDAARMTEALMEDPAKRGSKAVVAFGTNMGDRLRYIHRALELMERKAGRLLAVSDIIETKAYGYTDQDDFLNGAVMIDTKYTPRQLLDVLHEIEAELDRVRLIRWGPRTIDLDIIFFEDQIIDEEDLHIPHIDFRNRLFVMGPIAQIAPDLVDPRSGRKICDLLQELQQMSGTEEEGPDAGVEETGKRE